MENPSLKEKMMKIKKIPFVSYVDLVSCGRKDWSWDLGQFSIIAGFLHGIKEYSFRCYFTGEDWNDYFTRQYYIPEEEFTSERYEALKKEIQMNFEKMVGFYEQYFNKCDICGGQS